GNVCRPQCSVLCLLFLLSVCTACYISNRPIGGKRSALDFPSRKCMSWPGDRGRCFGPQYLLWGRDGLLHGAPQRQIVVWSENYLTFPVWPESCSHDHDLLMKLLHMISHTPSHRVHQ
ncbi:isotocin-neurophysin IT 1-like, partial [Oncorhynchus keta]|uniref:isotocin-neurophysin IT 1-like n=1 Tax=Oncorhynchus keta TaxID=8018 RepID=UPI002279FD2A